jgi:MoaE-MoaD fusion protein
MADSVRVRVLFFGVLKDISGRAEEWAEFPEGSTAGDVISHYEASLPKLAASRKSIVLAVNERFAESSSPVHDGDEVAFLPPVSGGTGEFIRVLREPAGHLFALTRGAIDVRGVRERLSQGCDGAVTVFEGIVRNNSGGRETLFLEYECYEGMAVETMAQIGREIAGQHEISRIAMIHRLGRMEIGETSVAIVVAAPHRKPAFAAALEGINRLKKIVPIWKKEHFADGAVWVEGDWDSSLAGR